jgi:GT2 family glycosyltransferase
MDKPAEFLENKQVVEPGITVVIVTYCRPKFLESILGQINNQTLLPVCIVVVDNDSNKSAKDVLTQSKVLSTPIPVIYVPNNVNSLSIGRNLGVSHVKTEFTCLLDDDVVIPMNYLEQVFESMNQLPNAVGVQGILNLGGRAKLKNIIAFLTGNFYLSNKTCKVRWSISTSYPKYSGGGTPLLCEWMSGTNQFYPTRVIKEVKWDENLLKYSDGEDLDHSLRVSRGGFGSLYLLPDLLLKHLETPEARVTGFKNVLMRECYSYYLLHKLFPKQRNAQVFFMWSRLSTLAIEIIQVLLSGFRKTKLIALYTHVKALIVVFHFRTELRCLDTSKVNSLL